MATFRPISKFSFKVAFGDAEFNCTEVSGLEVRVGNDGNRYFLAGLSIWKIEGTTIDGEEFKEEYAADKIAQSIGAGVVGPGRERVFFLPMETQLDPATVSIEIEIPDEEE